MIILASKNQKNVLTPFRAAPIPGSSQISFFLSKFMSGQSRVWLHHFSLNHPVVVTMWQYYASSFLACRVGFNVAADGDVCDLRRRYKSVLISPRSEE
jgi:hypothetical protein